jgi:hypothetical protein
MGFRFFAAIACGFMAVLTGAGGTRSLQLLLDDEAMRFSMIKIVGTRQDNGSYEYESTITELGGSTPWKSTFESPYAMISTMNAILARQKRDRNARLFLTDIHGSGQYFFDVDLTEEQAEFLGWQKRPEVESAAAEKQMAKPETSVLQRLPREKVRVS